MRRMRKIRKRSRIIKVDYDFNAFLRRVRINLESELNRDVTIVETTRLINGHYFKNPKDVAKRLLRWV